jgi:hypothetical protein
MKIKSIPIVAMVLLVIGLLGCERNSLNPLEPSVVDPEGKVVGGNVSATESASSKGGGKGGKRGIPKFEADEFVRRVDNPYFPLVPGTIYKYIKETEDGEEITEVKVTRNTKKILGVTTTEVRDRVFLDGELIEDTFDWFAQDERGNVWYFGEDTKEYENGVVVSTEGSWLAGKNGARPGIIMLAHPRVGDRYQQERAPGVAEDMARVVSLNESVKVPYGKFKRCLKTFESTPLEPTAREFKFYARGVGNVLTIDLTDGSRTELKSVSKQ